MQKIVCLDLEGVLVPEIWINVAKKTGIEALKRTTRDEPDYDVLMRGRLAILEEHKLSLSDIQHVIATMEPFGGALEFLNSLKEQTQVIILSDTFTQFAQPLMKKLLYPTLFCNTLVVDQNSMIIDYRLRQDNGKYKAVKALQSLGFSVFAAGDSYNDLTMIKAADGGALFKAPQQIIQDEPQLPSTQTYAELSAIVQEFLFQR
ncbi:MAG: bifunctional phosphoserine phosphatase/homoserine phosphotransferase ThrH [Sphaerochaetaceae bacterium]